MRRLLFALCLIAPTSDALAGGSEPPILRGSDGYVEPAPAPAIIRWGGLYAGGHLAYGYASMDFASSTKDLVEHMLRELALEAEAHPSQWQVLGKSDTHGAGFGGFVGYNNCWEEVVLGIEFNYSRVAFASEAPVSPITRVTSAGGNTYLVNITGSASMRITELATLRARAGVSIDHFLPYLMIGVAAGRANVARTATVSGTETVPTDPPTVTPFSFTESEVKNGAFLFGWSLGGGLDVMVMPQVFLRAEYEYIAFAPLWDIKSTVNIVRFGAGFKF